MTGRDEDRARATQARVAAAIMATTIVVWVMLNWVGGALGWSPALVFVFDFAALAAFVWALVMTYRIWRARWSN